MILTRVCTTKTQPHKQPPLSLSLSHTVAISKTQKAKNPEISKNRFFHFFFHFPLKVSQKPSHFLEKPNQNYLFFLSFLGVLKTHTHTQKKKKREIDSLFEIAEKILGFFAFVVYGRECFSQPKRCRFREPPSSSSSISSAICSDKP